MPSSGDVEERYVEKQQGHTSAELTRKRQRRRGRFRSNLTKRLGFKGPPQAVKIAGWVFSLALQLKSGSKSYRAVGTLSGQHTCEHISDVVLRAVENCRGNDFAAIFYR